MRLTWLLWVAAGALVGCASGSNTGGDNGGLAAADGTKSPSTGTDGSGTGGDGQSGDGAGGDGSGGSGNNDGVCHEYAVHSERVIPDMLIVLDKSGSMAQGGNTAGVDRWGGSVAGIKAITSALDSGIDFGLMVFPSDARCGAGTIEVPVGSKTAAAIASVLDGMGPDGATPTAISLDAARMELKGGGLVDPDAQPHPKYVLLVTDGAPNCGDGGASLPPLPICLPLLKSCRDEWAAYLSALSGNNGVTQKDVDDTVAQIEALAQDGIKTFVIGYNTKSDARLAPALDKMAQAGDTGDTEHRAVEDQTTLQAEFEKIAGKAMSCDFVLEEAPSDPSYVLVTVDGQQLNFGDANGWTLSPDGLTVTVQGSACEMLQGGQEHVLAVQVLCEVVVPI